MYVCTNQNLHQYLSNINQTLPTKQNDAARRRSRIDKPEYYVSHLLGHEGEGTLRWVVRVTRAFRVCLAFASLEGVFSVVERTSAQPFIKSNRQQKQQNPGSLLSYLKRQGLANALAAGFTAEMGDFALYDVRNTFI